MKVTVRKNFHIALEQSEYFVHAFINNGREYAIKVHTITDSYGDRKVTLRGPGINARTGGSLAVYREDSVPLSKIPEHLAEQIVPYFEFIEKEGI